MAAEPLAVSEEVGREAVMRCAAAVAELIGQYEPSMRADDPDACALCRLADRLLRRTRARSR
jgi:hypothetical protein